MVDLTPHPRKCEACRESQATCCLHRVKRLTGTVWEQWLCAECYQASHKRREGTRDVTK